MHRARQRQDVDELEVRRAWWRQLRQGQGVQLRRPGLRQLRAGLDLPRHLRHSAVAALHRRVDRANRHRHRGRLPAAGAGAACLRPARGVRGEERGRRPVSRGSGVGCGRQVLQELRVAVRRIGHAGAAKFAAVGAVGLFADPVRRCGGATCLWTLAILAPAVRRRGGGEGRDCLRCSPRRGCGRGALIPLRRRCAALADRVVGGEEGVVLQD
mmetsp:Transcript_86946/g.250829  ORF Transcript_86946/g.250829 Transcript_86946/m.250829 type:complete len:213 (+) Transcript_86946:181-819(+)